MGRLFGTDGIRGVANETLDAKLAYRVGQAAAISLCDDSGTKPTVVIGKDTRISSDMLEGALVAGLTACGCNAILLGVIPTPAVAYLTVYLHADAGVVISASHNPYEHNGIKIFGAQGYKLSDEMEEKVEDIVLSKESLPVKTHDQIGMRLHGMRQMKSDYIDHLLSTVDCDMRGLRVLVDCANGAASATAPGLFGKLPLHADFIFDKPDGININKIKKADLRRSLGVVLQEVNLFTGTVMENLRYGNPDATDEDCIAAAKLANADGFIRMLPQGYNTVLKGDGSGLSQGQRQLISIARAAVSDPPVMILDEATSSIDTRTEALVQDGMDKLMKGRTVFVIAHRLSTVQNSDVIMVLDHGHIIERGNHEKLINEKGTYYQLYTGAFELE